VHLKRLRRPAAQENRPGEPQGPPFPHRGSRRRVPL